MVRPSPPRLRGAVTVRRRCRGAHGVLTHTGQRGGPGGGTAGAVQVGRGRDGALALMEAARSGEAQTWGRGGWVEPFFISHMQTCKYMNVHTLRDGSAATLRCEFLGRSQSDRQSSRAAAAAAAAAGWLAAADRLGTASAHFLRRVAPSRLHGLPARRRCPPTDAAPPMSADTHVVVLGAGTAFQAGFWVCRRASGPDRPRPRPRCALLHPCRRLFRALIALAPPA